MKSVFPLTQAADIELEGLITISQMCQRLKISRTTLHRRVKARKFLQLLKRNNRTLGWPPEWFIPVS